MSQLVGVDIGTSSIKAVVIDTETTVQVGSASVTTPWTRGGTEADPHAILASVISAVEGAVVGLESEVEAIGIAGFAESGVVTDERGAPLAPVIAWHDPRGEDEAAALLEDIGEASVERNTGQPLSIRLSAVKYQWLRKRYSLDSRSVRWHSVPEWVVQQLGGEPRPDRSLWSRTGYLSIHTGDLWDEACAWSGLDIRNMPAPQASGLALGRVLRDHPCRPLRGAVMATGGHDHVAASVGAGCVAPDVIFDSWGNGEALLRSGVRASDVEPALRRNMTVNWHSLEGTRVLMCGLGTGILLRRVLTLLGLGDRDRAALDEDAEKYVGPTGISAAQLWGGDAELAEIAEEASAAQLWRGALDAAFTRVQIGREAIEDLVGPADGVVGCGGWLKSESIRRMKSRSVPGFVATSIAEPGAVGAAHLAGAAVGWSSPMARPEPA